MHSYVASQQSGSLVHAVQWLQGVLLGSVATTISIIAVASVGLLMLTGRIVYRRAISVVLGSFLIFGATTIVAGMQAAVIGESVEETPLPPDYAPSPLSPAPQAPMPAYGPYAGAAAPSG